MRFAAPRIRFQRSSRKDGAWRRRPVVFRLVDWFDGSRKFLALGVFERRWSMSDHRWIWRDAGSEDERPGSGKRPRASGWCFVRD